MAQGSLWTVQVLSSFFFLFVCLSISQRLVCLKARAQAQHRRVCRRRACRPARRTSLDVLRLWRRTARTNLCKLCCRHLLPTPLAPALVLQVTTHHTVTHTFTQTHTPSHLHNTHLHTFTTHTFTHIDFCCLRQWFDLIN